MEVYEVEDFKISKLKDVNIGDDYFSDSDIDLIKSTENLFSRWNGGNVSDAKDILVKNGYKVTEIDIEGNDVIIVGYINKTEVEVWFKKETSYIALYF